MSPQEFVVFLNKNFDENKTHAGWLATETNGAVFILDNANEFVASVSFYKDTPCFEFAESGAENKETILAMWQKYLADQEEDGDIDTQTDKTMARVTILVVIVTMVACALVAFGSLYLGSLLFN